jgi:hypothetical protein
MPPCAQAKVPALIRLVVQVGAQHDCHHVTGFTVAVTRPGTTSTPGTS